MTFRVLDVLALTLTLCATAAHGATTGGAGYPAKPVRILVGFTPGGSTDIVARLLAQRLSGPWGQPIVVDNRPGAGANIAAEVAARSAADGYTLLLAQNSLAISPALYAKMNYDARKDLVAIAAVALSPHMLVVHPSLPVRSVGALIALARARPGELNFASSGLGINDHMGGELFRQMAKLDVVHVAYKGGAESTRSILTGETSFYFAGILTVLPLIKQDRLRPLAITSTQRFKGAMDLPTMEEAGLKGFELVLWQGLFGPTGIEPSIVDRISKDVSALLRDPATVSQFEGLGLSPFSRGPAEFQAFFDLESEKWSRVLRGLATRL